PPLPDLPSFPTRRSSDLGSGKTAVTCALLQALLNRKLRPVAFKSGPDYIDPMFHTEVMATRSRNLDLFFLGEERVRNLLWTNGRDRKSTRLNSSHVSISY